MWQLVLLDLMLPKHGRSSGSCSNPPSSREGLGSVFSLFKTYQFLHTSWRVQTVLDGMSIASAMWLNFPVTEIFRH